MSLKGHNCFCGKAGIKSCSNCKFQRYCSKECQKSDWKEHKKVCGEYKDFIERELKHYKNLGLNGYINEHMRTYWKDELDYVLERSQFLMEESDLGYVTHYYVTYPKGVVLKDHNCSDNISMDYWSFVLICTRMNPNVIYKYSTDHKEGIASRFKDFYCSNDNILYVKDGDEKTNKLDDGYHIKCVKDTAEGADEEFIRHRNENTLYRYIDWDSGEVYLKDKIKSKYLNVKFDQEAIKLYNAAHREMVGDSDLSDPIHWIKNRVEMKKVWDEYIDRIKDNDFIFKMLMDNCYSKYMLYMIDKYCV